MSTAEPALPPLREARRMLAGPCAAIEAIVPLLQEASEGAARLRAGELSKDQLRALRREVRTVGALLHQVARWRLRDMAPGGGCYRADGTAAAQPAGGPRVEIQG